MSVSLPGRHWKQLRKTDPNSLGQANRQKPGSRRSQQVFYEQRGANCVTDREKSTTQIDYGCRLVDDRVHADRERVPPHH